uniref:ARAD1C33220p n=1 Tax=Blastobotrys adeninivorans TaxID=409370 RepID=A0A060T8X8_BLAAD
MSTQVHLYSTPLTLISIPRDAYPTFFFGIAKLLLGTWKDDVRIQAWKQSPQLQALGELNLEDGSSRRSSRIAEDNRSGVPNSAETEDQEIDDLITNLEEFISVTLTPLECSVICPSEIVSILFQDQLHSVGESLGVQVISHEYVPIQFDGDGLDSGQRVLAVSAPLSNAGISIFFLATYFSDYMLIPTDAKAQVVKALEDRGFTFSDSADSYVYQSAIKADGSQISRLEENTFGLLREAQVSPQVDRSCQLLVSGVRHFDDSVALTIVKTLVQLPQYFSVTITGGTEISLLLDRQCARLFQESTLLGSPTEYVTPVSFDLRQLPEDCTGIVTSVAGRLVRHDSTHRVHMSGYLSTAKSGVVLVPEEAVAEAVRALQC